MTPAEFDKHLAEQIGGFYADPLGYILFAFPWGKPGTPLERFPDGPDEWHREMFAALAEHVMDNVLRTNNGIDTEAWWSAVASGHGVGKSACVAWLILWLMSTRIDCRGVVTANTENQLTDKTWPELAKWHKLAINGHWFKWTSTQFYYAYYPEDQRKNYCFSAIPWSEEKTEGFAGLHNASSAVVFIFDEASAIPDKLKEVAEGGLTDGEGFFFSFGNPTRNTGWFFDCFHKDRALWWTKHVDSRSVRVTNKTRIKRTIDLYGLDSDVTRIRVLGLFPKGSLAGYIPYDLVIEAQNRELETVDMGSPLIMIVDVARFGDDKTVIRFRRGKDARSIPAFKFVKLSTVQVADRCIDLIEQYDPDLVGIEGAGPGGGVIDILRSRNYRVIEISPSSPPRNPRKYVNVRAECYGDARDWLRDGGCLDDDPQLTFDLTSIGFSFRESDTALLMESKKDMKKRKLPSPDDADAFALSFAVRAPRLDAKGAGGRKKRSRQAKGVNYNVHAY